MSYKNLTLENSSDIKDYLDQIIEALYILLGFTGVMSLSYETPLSHTVIFTVRRED